MRIRNYDYFVKQVAQTYIDNDAPDVWAGAKDAFNAGKFGTLIQAMNAGLQEYQQTLAKRSVDDILTQMQGNQYGLDGEEKNEMAYKLITGLMSHMRDTLWDYYWKNQLKHLSENLGLPFATLKY